METCTHLHTDSSCSHNGEKGPQNRTQNCTIAGYKWDPQQQKKTAKINGMLNTRYVSSGLHKIPNLTITLGRDYYGSYFRIALKSLSNRRKWCLEEEQLLQTVTSWEPAEVKTKVIGEIHERMGKKNFLHSEEPS